MPTNALFVAELKAISKLVTDKQAPSGFLAALEEMGIEVIIAGDEKEEGSA